MNKVNFRINSIKIKSNWFEFDSTTNKFKKIGGYKAFYIYITLFKFLLHTTNLNYSFITSISLLRKETKYSTKEIFDILKQLQRSKVIKITNLSRWDYLLDEHGEIKDKEIIMIDAIDVPKIEVVTDTKTKKTKEVPVDEDNYYITISLPVFQAYLDKKLNERYFPLYCLLNRLSNGFVDRKSFMKIEKMADTIGYDKDYVNKMIIELNRHYFLYSSKVTNKKTNREHYEHHLAVNLKQIGELEKNYKKQIDKFIAKKDKIAKQKRKDKQEQDEFIVVNNPFLDIDEVDNYNPFDSSNVKEINPFFDDDNWG